MNQLGLLPILLDWPAPQDLSAGGFAVAPAFGDALLTDATPIAGAVLAFGHLGIDALGVPVPVTAPTGPAEEVSPTWTRGAAVRSSIYLVEIDAALRPDAMLRAYRDAGGDRLRITPETYDRAVAVEAAEVLDAETTFRFATEIYATRPSDSPANVSYQPRVSQALEIDRQIPVSPLASRRVHTSLAEIVLNNADGELDRFQRIYAIDGRTVRVLKVDRGAAYSTAEVVFSGTASGPAKSSEDGNSVAIPVRDNTVRLDKPVQETLFVGDGGLEGGDDAKGKPVPLVLGYVRNVAPPLVDYPTQLFRIGEGPMRGVRAVRDAGVALSYAGDTTDIEAATVPAGHYKQSRTEGAIKLGSEQYGQITVDMDGRTVDGVYHDDAAELALYLVRRAGFADAEIDVEAFRALSAQRPWRVGLWTGLQPDSFSTAVDWLMRSINAWWGPDRDGRITCGLVKRPGGTPGGEIDASLLVDMDSLGPPEGLSPAVMRWRVRWDRNYEVQATLEVDPTGENGVTPDLKAFLAQPHRVAAYPADGVDADVQEAHPLAAEAGVETVLRDGSDAEALAEELFGLFDGSLRVLWAEIPDDEIRIGLGDVVTLRHERHGLDVGMDCRVVGVTFRASERAAIYRLLAEAN